MTFLSRNRMGTALFTMLLAAGLSLQASAQNRGPGGPGGPPPGRSPAGPGGPGGPGGNGGPPPGGSANGANNGGGPGGAAANGTAASGARPNALQLGPVGRWWDDKSVVKTLGLSATQQKKMDGIFDANKPAILASYKSLENEKAKLAVMTKQTQVDQSQVFTQIDAVSKARTELQKATTQMLLEIRQQMDPAQVTKLDKLP